MRLKFPFCGFSLSSTGGAERSVSVGYRDDLETLQPVRRTPYPNGIGVGFTSELCKSLLHQPQRCSCSQLCSSDRRNVCEDPRAEASYVRASARLSRLAALPFKPTWPRQTWEQHSRACAGERSGGEFFCDILIWIQGFCGTTGAADITSHIPSTTPHIYTAFIHQSGWRKLNTAGI